MRQGGFVVLFLMTLLLAAAPAFCQATGGAGGSAGGDAGAGLGASGSAGSSSTLGTVVTNATQSSSDIPGLLSGFSYLVGIVLGVWGILKLKEHVENPNNIPLSDSMKRFVAGGALFALPTVMEAAFNTMKGSINNFDTTGFTGQTTGSGLDAMVVKLMSSISGPMWVMLDGFCYLAGIVFIIIGIMRLLKNAQEGPRGPGGIGTIMTFLTAGALFSITAMLDSWSNSLFGTDKITTDAALAYSTGMDAGMANHIKAVMNAVEAFMMIIGFVSFIRGWFIIRDVAEGDKQASMMAGMTHLFGGALAVNLGPLMNAVQSTLGITDYGVKFQ